LIKSKDFANIFPRHDTRKLRDIVKNAGLRVTRYSGGDLLYVFCEIGNFKGNNLKEGTFAYWFSHQFESSWLKTIGAQSITISVKTAEKMHCFICGEKKATPDSLV
jgi:hypothetical protein